MSLKKTGAAFALLAVTAFTGWSMTKDNSAVTSTTPVADVATTTVPTQKTTNAAVGVSAHGIGEPMTFRSTSDVDTSKFFLGDENPEWLQSFTDEQLLSVIRENQPYGPAAMAVLGLRQVQRGSLEPGSQWLLKHFEVTGKSGPLHSAVFYLGRGEENQLALYKFMSILVATEFPAYRQKKLDQQRARLSSPKQKIDAIDQQVRELLRVTSNMNAAGTSNGQAQAGGMS